MLEHARRFLSLVLPDNNGAYYNIHWAQPGQNGRKFWDGRACEGLDEFIKTLQWLLKTGDHKDIYVCMSTQQKMEEKTSVKGFKYKKAVRGTMDAVELKSLFIDIDVKAGAYPSTKEALRALKEFITSQSIPSPSAVVASGSGGFHAHWALDRSLPRDQWQVLANALVNAAQDFGLKFDSQCTVDAARILRIPETFNWKTDEAKAVKLLSIGAQVSLDEMRASLGSHIKMAPVPGVKIAANDELGANIATAAPDIDLAEVAKHCGFVGRTISTGGRDNPQPLWFLTASLSTFIDDGRTVLHQMSKGHPGYDPAKTDELYQRVVETQKKRDLGWPKCEKIAAYGAPECASCPLRAQNKSPLNFALKAANDVPDANLPQNYVRNAEGIILRQMVDESGSPMISKVCHYPILHGWISTNPYMLHVTTRTDVNRKTILEIPTEVVMGSKDTFSKTLGSKGLFCDDRQSKNLKEFFLSWIQKLQTQKDSVISASPFGWVMGDNGKLEGFAYAGRVWMDGQDRPAANPSAALAYQYTPKGTYDYWKQLSEVICGHDRPGLNALVAAAFAAPLVRFTGHPGLVMAGYSKESGIGKTTALRLGQAVWGHPRLAPAQLDDTPNSVLGKMGQLKVLPMYWDEIKSEMQVKRFCSMIFQMTSGREKNRMNQNAELKISGEWQTLVASTSNDSLVDPMAREFGSTTAGLHRLFEFMIPAPAEKKQMDGSVQRLLGKLEDNYGQVGLAYSKFLGANFTRIEQEVAKLNDELYTDLDGQQEERMWITVIAVLIKGADYANELGFTTIDVVSLRAFLVDTLTSLRHEVGTSTNDMSKSLSVSTVLSEFLKATRARNTLRTNRIWVSPGKPTKGAIRILNDLSRVENPQVQIGEEDGLIRITSTFFTKWMGERGYSRKIFMDEVKARYGVREVNGILGGGTDYSLGMTKEMLIQLDMNHPELAKLLSVGSDE